MTRRNAMALGTLTAALAAASDAAGSDILDLPPPKADARIQYGSGEFQFGDLRLPGGSGPHPLVVWIHGGYWRAAYSLEHAGHACSALTRAGAVTWNLEYRRIGNPGGGWPGTFEDCENGARHVHELAKQYPLDLKRVVVAGHSAGGQLAVWLAAQKTLDWRGVVSLAGVLDLKRAWELRLSNGVVADLLGGSPAEQPERYAKADPMERLPIATKQRILHGTADHTVPFEIAERFAKASPNADLIALDGAGHFELIDPRTPQWKVVERSVLNWNV